MSLTKEQATARVQELKDTLNESFSELSRLAIEHNIHVYVDGPTYGMGGYVVTEAGEYGWSDYEVGDWLASSQSC